MFQCSKFKKCSYKNTHSNLAGHMIGFCFQVDWFWLPKYFVSKQKPYLFALNKNCCGAKLFDRNSKPLISFDQCSAGKVWSYRSKSQHLISLYLVDVCISSRPSSFWRMVYQWVLMFAISISNLIDTICRTLEIGAQPYPNWPFLRAGWLGGVILTHLLHLTKIMM